MTKKEKKLIAVIGLVVILLTACASKAANATEKIELGQKYLTEANYTEAIAAFTEVIKIDPSNIEAYMGRAEAYKGLKQYDDAKADYIDWCTPLINGLFYGLYLESCKGNGEGRTWSEVFDRAELYGSCSILYRSYWS